jgi:hypothetical protein
MNFKGFLADHMGHFTIYDLPGVIFVVLLAAVLGWSLAFFGGREKGSGARHLALWSATAALGVAFMRMQLPVALALLAIVLLVRPTAADARQRILLFGALVAGLGCGSGAGLIMAIAMVPYVLLVRWAMGSAVERQGDVL